MTDEDYDALPAREVPVEHRDVTDTDWESFDAEYAEVAVAKEEGRELPAKRCKAHNRSGALCGQPVVDGKEVCRFHGGLSPGRPLQSGKYSKFLPARLRDRYEEFLSTPGWLELKEEIGLLAARIADLMEGLEAGEAPITRRDWLEKAEAVKSLHLANEDFSSELNSLIGSLKSAVVDDDIWDKTEKSIEQKRKLHETEVKRMVAANQVLSVQESYTLIQRMVSLAEDLVDDERKRAKMIRELHALLERKNDPKALNSGRAA